MQEKELDTKVRDMFFLLDDEAKVAYVKVLIRDAELVGFNNALTEMTIWANNTMAKRLVAAGKVK